MKSECENCLHNGVCGAIKENYEELKNNLKDSTNEEYFQIELRCLKKMAACKLPKLFTKEEPTIISNPILTPYMPPKNQMMPALQATNIAGLEIKDMCQQMTRQVDKEIESYLNNDIEPTGDAVCKMHKKQIKKNKKDKKGKKKHGKKKNKK